MNLQEIIIRNPEIFGGKPIIANTRISVEIILKKMSEGASFDDLNKMYPQISNLEILACLEYASNIISNEELIAV